jgi:hypothetical protein
MDAAFKGRTAEDIGQEIWFDFGAHGVIGGFDTVFVLLQKLVNVGLQEPPRLADFHAANPAFSGIAVESVQLDAQGIGHFLRATQLNIHNASRLSSIGPALVLPEAVLPTLHTALQ